MLTPVVGSPHGYISAVTVKPAQVAWVYELMSILQNRCNIQLAKRDLKSRRSPRGAR